MPVFTYQTKLIDAQVVKPLDLTKTGVAEHELRDLLLVSQEVV